MPPTRHPRARVSAGSYLARLAADPFFGTHPAVDPLHWYARLNNLRLLEPFYAGTFQQGLISLLPSDLGGLAANFNADSSFLYGYADRDLRPAAAGHNILCCTGSCRPR
jgi:hypothetical protein